MGKMTVSVQIAADPRNPYWAFDYCSLPTAKAKQTFGVFDKDAQAGTVAARENSEQGNQLRLSNEQIQEITEILQRHPIIKESGFIAPGTLRISEV